MKAKDVNLNDRQLYQVGLIVEAVGDCEHKPALGGLRHKETGDEFVTFQFEAGDEDVIVMFGPDEILTVVDSDDENKKGKYRVDEACEWSFIGSLINCIWMDDYENLISDFLESDPSRN